MFRVSAGVRPFFQSYVLFRTGRLLAKTEQHVSGSIWSRESLPEPHRTWYDFSTLVTVDDKTNAGKTIAPL